MNTTKHTAEPWSIHNNIGRKSETGIIADAAPCIIATMSNADVWPLEAQANAQRIVSCVNSLAGIEEPEKTAPEMVEALRQASFAIPTTHGAFETVRSIIAKIKKG